MVEFPRCVQGYSVPLVLMEGGRGEGEGNRGEKGDSRSIIFRSGIFKYIRGNTGRRHLKAATPLYLILYFRNVSLNGELVLNGLTYRSNRVVGSVGCKIRCVFRFSI